MKKLLEIKEITKVFGEGTVNEKVALNHVNLTLHSGDFVTVIGNNGAGNSTLLNCIAGVYAAELQPRGGGAHQELHHPPGRLRRQDDARGRRG